VDELDLMHQSGDQHFYETKLKGEHAHIICLRCGRVEEFFGDPLQRLRKQVEAHFGFQILITRTEIGGYCSHCQVLRAREFDAAARTGGAGDLHEHGETTKKAQSKTAPPIPPQPPLPSEE
jgi:Fur family ferric uptake transcriptional regulator